MAKFKITFQAVGVQPFHYLAQSARLRPQHKRRCCALDASGKALDNPGPKVQARPLISE